MNIMYVCPNCNKIFKLSGKGVTAKCKYCGDSVLISLDKTEEEWAVTDAREKKKHIEQILSQNSADTNSNNVEPKEDKPSHPENSMVKEEVKESSKTGKSFFDGVSIPKKPVIPPNKREVRRDLPICHLNGVRGRKMTLYINRCEIETEVTVGSVLTQNATDGRKTIFFIDCVGVQIKHSGLLVGYLQFETSTGQMNNLKDNMFAENTFTYEDGKNGITNDLIEEIYKYVCDMLVTS